MQISALSVKYKHTELSVIGWGHTGYDTGQWGEDLPLNITFSDSSILDSATMSRMFTVRDFRVNVRRQNSETEIVNLGESPDLLTPDIELFVIK